ncbi:MAG: SMP-30/gluconolactonase/LRE family protein [Planctomycetes bacterium]|nr:SMP-30/gluconolactonase/LRE family protein [Planctomycetota bacterium]
MPSVARTTIVILLLVAATPAQADDVAPAGVYTAEEVPGSPKMTAAGMVWWKDRLIIADRGGKRLVAFTPPDKFEPLREVPQPVGLAVDQENNLILTEKDPPRIVRIKPDGTEKILADTDVGTPHFVTVHKSGRIFWSGFPDGGTRSLNADGKVTILKPRIGHTYGIGTSPKQDFLYVASKLPNADVRAVWRFPLDPDGKPGDGEVFFKTKDLKTDLPKLPAAKDGAETLVGWVGRLQGLAVDQLGNVYIAGAESHTSGEAVAVVSPDGKKVIAMILGVPRNVSGLAFGGKDGRTLYITGAGEYRLHQIPLPAAGVAH